MKGEPKLTIPPKLLAVDTIGTLLFGLGVAKQVAGIDVLPDQLRFTGYGAALIVVGVVLMLPLIFFLISAARARKEIPSGRSG